MLNPAGVHNAQIQKISDASVGGAGYQISTKTLGPEGVKRVQAALDTHFGSGPNVPGTRDFSSTSIGPTFGKTVANSAVIAIIASLLVISAYIALRFEWKYAVPVLIALMHDLLITAGVYALTGREVTTATVAALLTILGYSLYDTIIVFDRVRENVPRMPRAAFSQIVNRSMSEVLTRSLATSLCTLLPVLALLLFGGETLKDFAFALMIGIASGAYSSIFIASPVLTHWKEREAGYRTRRTRIVRELGVVPAYATTASGAPEDVEPEQVKRRRRRGRLTEPEEPGAPISRDEFQELVRDIDVEGDGAGAGGAAVGGRRAKPAEQAPTAVREEPPPAAAPERDPAADLTPEDLVLKEEPKPRQKSRAAAQPTPREVSLMGVLGWVMMGLAIWHFTVWIPDRFWGGIVGAFLGSLIGSIVTGFAIYGAKVSALRVPGEKGTTIAVVLYAVPGALIGMAIVYLEGMRRERHGAQPGPAQPEARARFGAPAPRAARARPACGPAGFRLVAAVVSRGCRASASRCPIARPRRLRCCAASSA